MLKSITLNRKKVPVPVPLNTLKEAIDWVESDLLSEDRTITQITLDGHEIELVEGATGWESSLSEASKLYMRVDSAWDLCLQTLDAARNLASVLDKSIEPIAVRIWQLKEDEQPDEKFMSFNNDLFLVLDLADHLLLLLPDKINATALKRTCQGVQVFADSLNISFERKQWRELVKKMVNGLKPKLMELATELDGCQRTLFEIQGESRGGAVSK